MLYGKMGRWTFFCPPTWLLQYKWMEISKLRAAITLEFISISTWNLRRPFKTGLFTLCKNFVKKVADLNFWWRHCKPWIQRCQISHSMFQDKNSDYPVPFVFYMKASSHDSIFGSDFYSNSKKSLTRIHISELEQCEKNNRIRKLDRVNQP